MLSHVLGPNRICIRLTSASTEGLTALYHSGQRGICVVSVRILTRSIGLLGRWGGSGGEAKERQAGWP